MDTITYPTPRPTISQHRKNQTLLYVFLGLIVVLSIIYFIMVKQKLVEPDPLSVEVRMQTLRELASVSASATPSPEEQVNTLKSLESASTATTTNQYETLNALSKQ